MQDLKQADIDPQEFYRTNEMAEAAFLRYQGHAVQRVAWEGQTCYWIFRITDQLLDDDEAYLDSKSTVEPREYNRMFSMTKREFFDTQPSDTRRRGGGVPDAARS